MSRVRAAVDGRPAVRPLSPVRGAAPITSKFERFPSIDGGSNLGYTGGGVGVGVGDVGGLGLALALGA
ncbi:MAG: hypothetical protein ACJ780_19475 [Solirubrobacteraceae bacterium]